jgi:hypothetical protein
MALSKMFVKLPGFGTVFYKDKVAVIKNCTVTTGKGTCWMCSFFMDKSSF